MAELKYSGVIRELLAAPAIPAQSRVRKRTLGIIKPLCERKRDRLWWQGRNVGLGEWIFPIGVQIWLTPEAIAAINAAPALRIVILKVES